MNRCDNFKAVFFRLLRTLSSRLFVCKWLGLWFVGTVKHRRNTKPSIDFIHILSPRMSDKVRQFAKTVRIEYAKILSVPTNNRFLVRIAIS